MEQEDIYPLEIAKMTIYQWKRFFFKKNSKYPASIQLRCNHSAEQPIFWKYYLQLWINNKLKDQIRIDLLAWDTFNYDKSLRKDELTNCTIVFYKEFIPLKKIVK